jgi:pimeloyl-ACP methyl ester carboxylesterase
MPFTSFGADVRAVARDLGALPGPTMVVGHSYGGFVMTEAASKNPNVCGLVYVAGLVANPEETPISILAKYPTPAGKLIVPVDPDENPQFVIVQRDKIPEFFCPDVFPRDAAAIAATAAPMSSTLLKATISTEPAWQRVPTWCLIFSEDRFFHPNGQREMAERAAPPERIDSIRASHAGIVSRPLPVALFIEQAARECADPRLRSSDSAPVSTRLG